MPTAKLIPDGDSQIVCIPDEYRFDADEVQILKHRDGIVLRPKPRAPAVETTAARAPESRADGQKRTR